jgi:type I restriction enzyme S subunit
MDSHWQQVALREIAKPVTRPVEVIAGQPYRTIGVKWWGEGAYERLTIDGSQTAAKTLSLVREGDLIINKIWVRHGSTAVASAAVDGCAASGEFPMFTLDSRAVLPRWIHWHTKTPPFWEKCDALSRGTSGRNRIKPDLFLTITIPLPPLTEQKRVLLRIEELAAKVEKANDLRRQATEELGALAKAAADKVWSELANRVPSKPILDVLDFQGGSQPPKHTFRHEVTTGYVRFLQIRDFSTDAYLTFIPNSPRNSLANPRDVLIGRYGASLGKILRGKEGAYNVAMCKAVPKVDEIDNDFLAHALSGGPFQERLREINRSAQAGFNKGDLRDVPFLMPPLADQHSIVAYLDNLQSKVERLKAVQSQTAATLQALMPSILSKAFRGEL